jgi:4'-phosphopantetheinyl transferase
VPFQRQYLNAFKEILSEDEKRKAAKFRFEKDRDTSIIARGSLRFLLGKYLNMPPKAISFSYGEFGKPKVETVQNLKFNVSHSKDFIVIGFVKNYDIGIDVEFIKKDFDVMEIVDNYFSKHEIKFINNIHTALQTEVFFRGWTRKEAFIKAKAKGLAFALDSFSISIDSDASAVMEETLWNSSEKYTWNIVPFETSPDYKAALAVNGKINSTHFFDFNLSQLTK